MINFKIYVARTGFYIIAMYFAMWSVQHVVVWEMKWIEM